MADELSVTVYLIDAFVIYFLTSFS